MLAAPFPATANELDPTGEWSANENGQADLPPMGWNSWNAFHTDIDEEKVMASARVIVESGLAAKGYRYVNIDDGWWLKRNQPDGRMVIRTATFPSAKMTDGTTSFRPFTDALHKMGLKAGIYSDIGPNSCAQIHGFGAKTNPEGTVAEREVGLYGHIDQDIALYFKEWGFDYIKVDGCGIRGLAATTPLVANGTYRALAPLIDYDFTNRTDIAGVKSLFDQVGQALVKHNPDGDFTYSICIWGSSNVRSWAPKVGNLWRTSEDILPRWDRMLHNLDSAAKRELYAQPGSWNDPDMLFIGTGDFDASHPIEARSHFSLWAMLNAPLIIGFDLRKATPDQLAILGNKQVIALNQDMGGHQAVLAFDTDELQYFVKTLASGEKAVAMFNRTSAPIKASLTAAQMKFAADKEVKLIDLWDGREITFTSETEFVLAPRQTLVFRASGTRQLSQGIYVSEIPGNVFPAADGVTSLQHDPTIHRGLGPWTGTKGGGERPRYAGWGGARADSSPWGQSLSISGRKFASGVGIMANSRLEVRNTGYSRLTAHVGLDDSGPVGTRRVRFEVYGDGKLLTRTGWVKAGDMPQAIDASVADMRIIELVARADKNRGADFPVTWGEAAMLR